MSSFRPIGIHMKVFIIAPVNISGLSASSDAECVCVFPSKWAFGFFFADVQLAVKVWSHS